LLPRGRRPSRESTDIGIRNVALLVRAVSTRRGLVVGAALDRSWTLVH
jgi:hypothetical protein